MKKISILFCFATLIAGSCNQTTDNQVTGSLNSDFALNQPDSCNHLKFSYENFNINQLEIINLPYYEGATKINEKYLLDANNVPIHEYNGKKNYHPVYIVQYGLHLVDVYNSSEDTSLISRLYLIAHKLTGISLELDSSLFLPYSFNFPLHGNSQQTLYSPWYSAMAQGQALSFFCRLFTITQNPKYLIISQKLFNSFGKLKAKESRPWISCIDSKANLWLEEYPMDLPCFTLNGMIFGIYGIYDYYLITNSSEALLLLKASITTIKNNIIRFRNEKDISYYCLKHKVKDIGYHNVHIDQLKMLNKITGDAYFLEMANKFQQDTKK